MAVIRLKFRDQGCRRLTTQEQLTNARRELAASERAYELVRTSLDMPPVLIERRREEYEAAKRAYDQLHFAVVDHANPYTHLLQLRALNLRNTEFWRRK